MEEVRLCLWFAHFSNKQAAEVTRTIKELTKIAYHEYVRDKEWLIIILIDKKIGRTFNYIGYQYIM